ncbi:MAG: WD40 repeat domain-containing protein [Sulfuricaulis sp.]
MIFSRSCRRGNAVCRTLFLIGLALATGGILIIAGCASPPSIPANVILQNGHNSGYTLAFDNRSETLASGSSGGHIRLWQLPDGKELSAWKADSDSLKSLQFLNHDRELLSASYDRTLARWTRNGTLLQRITTPAPITSMAADEPSALIITGHTDGHVRLWRLPDLSLIGDLRLHRGAVLAVAFHATRRLLASSGTDGRVFLWRLGQEPHPLPSPPTNAQDLAFSPDGTVLMGSGWFHLLRWRLDNETMQILPTAHHGLIKSISFSRDGRMLASIGRQTDSAVYLLDAQTGAVLKRFQPHELCGTYVRLSPDDRYLASTSDDASIHIWDLRHPLPAQTFFRK